MGKYMSKSESLQNSDFIAGRNPVEEALKSDRALNALFVTKGSKNGSLPKLIAIAKSRNIPVKEVDVRKLDAMSAGSVHQGVVASCAVHSYCTLEDILDSAKSKGEEPFIIILDGIEDPHNLGAIIRTAEACGAHGVVIPERRGVGLTGIVAKASAGAVEYVPVARVKNTAVAIETLKSAGVWIYGLDMDGEDYRQTDFSGAVGLVVGSEGRGISRLVKEKCDFIVSIPMRGNVNSLNASVAAGIVMYGVR